MGKKHTLFISLVSLLGILDAAYLTYEHYAGGIPPCTINGCETVLTSPYATIIGIPVSLFGLGFYISVFIVSLLIYKKELSWGKLYLLASTGFGFLFSLYLLYLQTHVIGAFCQYCIFSLLTSTVLFVLSLFLFLKRNKETTILNP